MMDVKDEEFERWSEDWRTNGEAPGDAFETLQRQVRRRTRNQALFVAFETVVAAVVLVMLGQIVLRRGAPIDFAVTAAFTVMTFWAGAFSLWNRRGTWRPSGETTGAFLDLSELRLGRRLRGLRFGLYLLGAEVLVLAPWLLHAVPARSGMAGRPVGALDYVLAFGFLLGWCSLFLAGILIARRKTLSELEAVSTLRKSLLGG